MIDTMGCTKTESRFRFLMVDIAKKKEAAHDKRCVLDVYYRGNFYSYSKNKDLKVLTFV